MTDFNLTTAYITSLTGNPNTECDWRIINDRNAGEMGINLRGSLTTVASQLQAYNQQGYGIFMTVNAMNPTGPRTLENVAYTRAHVVDLDDIISAQDSYNRAVRSNMPPHFAVQSSQGKFHLYWLVEPYKDNDFYSLQQRKLVQLYNSDPNVIDATRILRVPGFYHNKSTPQLVTCWGIHNGPRYTAQQIADNLATINIVSVGGKRSELGDPKLAAPNINLLVYALNTIDPNTLTRDDWMATSAAFKQAGWSLTDENTLHNLWLQWCEKYHGDNKSEDLKMWTSFKDTQVGWSRFCRLVPEVLAMQYFGQPSTTPQGTPAPAATPEPCEMNNLPEILDATAKQIWFKNCFFVESEGKIFSPTGRFMNQVQFNGRYGGKEFTIKSNGGKLTDEPWKAALRSIDWSIPKVDHCRFLPQEASFSVIVDDMGRKGLNTYIPANIKAVEGDVSRWKDYLTRIFNTPEDIKIFEDYVAHCIKFPGWKIPWSVLLQSAKGIGKQMISDIIKHAVGEPYTYQPDAEELVSGVSQFNGWMRNKLMILVDEVRVGDRNDLMNGLKTIITDRRIAIESKGVDQEMEDNVANWIFFSNFKDAFPIDENERRYCIFYSKLQSALQIEEAGLNKDFFDGMYHWLECEEGFEKLAWYYLHYPIERGSLPHRAPHTSSYEEVIRIGRSPLRVILDDKINAGERGFRGGYVSYVMFQKAVAESSMRNKPLEHTLKAIIESKGYYELGYTKAPVPGEDLKQPSLIFGLKGLSVDGYEGAQD